MLGRQKIVSFWDGATWQVQTVSSLEGIILHVVCLYFCGSLTRSEMMSMHSPYAFAPRMSERHS